MFKVFPESAQNKNALPVKSPGASVSRVEVLNWLLLVVVAVQAVMLILVFRRVSALERILLPAEPVTVERIPDERGQVYGAADAGVTLVEFADFECPACGEAAPAVKALVDRYPDRVRLVFRNYPLSGHPNAYLAAAAAECAGRQDKYWEMHQTLFAHQDALELSELLKYAGSAGLELEDFETCLQSDEIRKDIDRDLADGKRYQVSGTPTFYVNQLRVTGLSGLEKSLEEALEEATK